MKRKYTIAAASALAAGLTALAAGAHAENRGTDCGPAGSYQASAPWPSGGGCVTNLSQGPALGPVAYPDGFDYEAWRVTTSWLVEQPVIGLNDDIFFGSDTTLFAYRKNGTKRWSANVGARIGGAPAIGPDGTIYVAGANGYVGAREYNGGFKWQLNAGTATFTTDVTVGQNGALFVGDNAGSVQALLDGDKMGWLWWKYALGSGRATKMALSQDGSMLYVATSNGYLHAINTADGTTVFKREVGSAAINALTVLGAGSLLTGDDAGQVRLHYWNGAIAFTTKLGDKIRAVATAPNRTVYVLSQSGTSPTYTRLHALDRTLAPSATFDDDNWRTMPDGAYSLVVDAESNVYGMFRSGAIVGVSPNGRTLLNASLTSAQSMTSAAMNSEGAIVFAQGFGLAQSTPGSLPTNLTVNYKPRVPYFDGDGTPSWTSATAKQCNNTYASGARPGYDWKANADKKIYSLTLNSAELDQGCPVQFCTDGETVITSSTDIGKLLSVSQNAIANLPAVYNVPRCAATSYEGGCSAIDPDGVHFDDDCNANADCDEDQICSTVCPEEGNTGRPKNQCTDAQRVQVCVDLDPAGCSSLPYAADCHELRECAAPADRVSAQDAQPACFSPTNTIPATIGAVDQAKLDACEDTDLDVKEAPWDDQWQDHYPDISLWATNINTCLLTNPENETNADGGGNGADSGRRNKSKWGLWAGASADMNFGLKPQPMGFITPDAYAHANFDVLAKVWGKEIIVLDVGASANIDKCNIKASTTTKLFNQSIDALPENSALANTAETGDCSFFYEKLQWGAGNIKNYLMAASRAYQYVMDAKAEGRPPAVTLEMCRLAYRKPGVSDPPECKLAYTPERAANVVNLLIDKYNKAIQDMQPGGKWYEDAKSSLLTHMGAASGFSKNNTTGKLSKNIPLDLPGLPYSIVGAQASFPLGPFIGELEISGSGRWGLDGSISYGATYLPPAPGASASIVVNPHANTEVVVYMGAGFGVPGASVTLGALGKLTLVDIHTKLQGTTSLKVEKTDSQFPARTWPSAFRRFQGGALQLSPQQFNLTPSASLRAGLTLTALTGELDVALRAKFLFFSKTFKRRIAELKGKSWSYEWVGTFKNVASMPTVTLPALDPIPFPTIPKITNPAATFTWLNGGSWPTQLSFPSGSPGRTHAAIMGEMPPWCEVIVL